MIDGFLKYQHLVEKRANQLQKDMLQALQDVRVELTGRLMVLESDILKGDFNAEPYTRRKKLLLAQRAEVEKVMSGVYEDIGVKLKDAGEDVLAATAISTAKIMNGALGVSLSFTKLSKADIASWFETATTEGLLIRDYLKKLEAGTVDRITKTVRQAMISGKGSRATARLLKEKGIEGSSKGLEGLSRTMMHSASHHAKERAAEAHRHLMKGWRYLATLDDRTCLVCAANDNKFYSLKDNKPILPRHWRCRCVYVPETKTDSGSDGTRAARGPEGDGIHVPEKMTYNAWLRRQLNKDPEFVKNILGPARFELFKSGKLSVRSMVAEGRIKSLKEIVK